MKLAARVRAIGAAIDARALSERRLLMLVLMIVIATAWFAGLQRPLLQRIDALNRQGQDLQQQLAIEKTTFSSLQTTLQSDPNQAKRDQLTRSESEIGRLDTRLAERALKVISPEQMVQALRDVLEGQRGLHLESLQNLAVEPAFKATESAAAKSTGAAVPAVYRHRVRIALRGEYLSVLRYVNALETLPWQFQWENLAIEMADYPVARVVMQISTLSLGENWIGT